MVYDYKTCAIIRDRETGEIVSRLAEGCYNYSLYQEKDTVYVLGTKSEEWVMCNTFYNWKDFELTSYGKIKLDFLDIIKKYPKEKIGTPYTPIAVVLPKDLFGIAGLDDGENQTVFGYPLSGSNAKTMRNVRKALKYLLSNPSDMVGSEKANIINSHIPDCIDVMHEDYINLYDNYKFFVDLTGNSEFRKIHRCISC